MHPTRPGTDAGGLIGCRSRERALRWCLKRTLRDARLASRTGRSITSHNLRRLLSRRVWAVMDGWQVEPGLG